MSPNNKLLIHSMINKASKEEIEKLLNEGVDISLQNANGLNGLHFAVFKGRYDIVEILLRDGMYINRECCHGNRFGPFSNYEGYRAIHLNAEKGDKQICEILIARGADINVTTKAKNETPLHIAVSKGHVEIVRILLGNGCDLNAINSKRFSALQIAVRNCCTEEQRKSVIKPTFVICRFDCRQPTACDTVDYRTNLEIILLLLEQNCDTNLLDKDGCTALHLAARSGLVEIAEYLLQYGADANCADKTSVTPLLYACKSSSVQIVRALLNYNVRDINFNHPVYGTALHIAVSNGCTEIARMLMEHGAKVDMTNLAGDTVLHIACFCGNVETVRLTLKFGCVINVYNNYHCTPLHYATMKSNVEIVETLLMYGADPNVVELQNGEIPLHIACRNKQIKIVKLLLKHSSKVNIQNKEPIKRQPFFPDPACFSSISNIFMETNYMCLVRSPMPSSAERCGEVGCNNTPLHIACGKKNLKMVQLLLKYECELNVQNAMKQTALLIAVSKGCLMITQLLLQSGADVTLSDKDGRTPLFIACENRNKLIAKLLLDFGCDVNMSTKECDSPLHVTVQKNDFNLVEILLNYGADVNAVDSNGRTVMHIACDKVYLDIVRLLLSHDCDVNVKDLLNQVPLEIAVTKRADKIIVLLLDYDCDIDLVSYLKKTKTTPYVKVVFLKYIIKLQVLGNRSMLQKTNILTFNADLYKTFINTKLFRRECEKEIAVLKNLLIGDSRFSLYDILIKDVDQLMECLRNSSVMDVLKGKLLKRPINFNVPVYSDMIQLNFIKGLNRMTLLESCFRIIHLVFQNQPPLPDICVMNIVKRLPNKDLATITNLFPQVL